MEAKLIKYSEKLIEWGFYGLVFLVPLVFTPKTFELFEFPKMILVYFLTILIVAAFLIKSIVAGKFNLKRTPLDKPIAVLLIVNILAAVFSIDRYTSIFGYYTRFNGGLLSLICYVALYYVFVGEIGKSRASRERFVKSLLLSAALVSAYGILQHFGIDEDYWVQDVRRRVFSTLGQPNWLAAYLVMVIPVSLSQMLRRARGAQLQHIFLSTILYVAFWFTYSRSGLLGFGAAMVTFLIFVGKENLKRHWRPLVLVGIAWAVISILAFSPTIADKIPVARAVGAPPTAKQERGSTGLSSNGGELSPDSSEPRSVTGSTVQIRLAVWKGALNLIKDHPILGTGPETFAYSFLPYRPVELNQTAEWEFLYNKAHNEYLNLATTTGLLGLAAYLWIVGKFILWNTREWKRMKERINANERILGVGVFAGWVGVLVSNFFGFSVVATSLLFWLFMALGVSYGQEK